MQLNELDIGLFCFVDVSVWYDQTSYTISEQKDYAELCVPSDSSGIEEIFTLNLTTNSTASSKSIITVYAVYENDSQSVGRHSM